MAAQPADPLQARLRRRRHLIEASRAGALIALVFAVWARVYDKWTPSSFAKPIEYWGDAMLILGLAKSAGDFGFLPFLSKTNPHLGAPFVARFDDWPMSEELVVFFTGMLSRVTGIIAAVNLAYLGAALGAALAMYLVGRWLKLRWEACFLAGALFGLSPYLFFRNVQHFTLTCYWFVPLFVPVWIWAGGKRGLDLKDKRFLGAAAVAVLAGFHNVYYLSYFLEVLALCVLAQVFRRRWRKALSAAAIGVVAALAFGLCNLDTVYSRLKFGPNPGAVHRRPAEMEIFALRPVELFTPGVKHRIGAFAERAQTYRSTSALVGEFPSNYLGVVGGVALLALVGSALLRAFLGRPLGWARLGVYSLVLVLMSVVGGGMQYIQTIFGTTLLRSNNRVSIFLSMLALLFLARQLSVMSRRWPRPVLPVAAAGLLAVGLYDQTPAPRMDGVPHPELVPEWEKAYWTKVAGWEKSALADQHLIAELERRVTPGTAVFELPPMSFPEGGGAGGLADYEMFRPYLYAKNLRFSYGNMKGRAEAGWQFSVAGLPPRELVATLEQFGFGALYINRNAYGGAAVQEMLRSFNALGRSEVLESEIGDSVVVLLRPSATPTLPRL